MKIAVDAMGGDRAPDVIVEGAVAAAHSHRDVTIILVGDEVRIRACLGSTSPSNINVVHASDVIGGSEEPVKAVRRKKDSSLVVAAHLVKNGEAHGLVSAGNTGALMTAGLLVIGRMDGIERPALAPVLPTVDGRGMLLLDAGANMDADPTHLLQYAQMGHAYWQKVMGVAKPRIALLNIGEEAGKGNNLTKEAYALLHGGKFHFIGNVESRDMMHGQCDVLVCDGFVGNIVLKQLEGIVPTIYGMLQEVFLENWRTKLATAVLRPGLRRMKRKMDYAEYGGAPLLGVDGACVKAHGSSNGRAVSMAIEQAIRFVQGRVLDEVKSMVQDSQQ